MSVFLKDIVVNYLKADVVVLIGSVRFRTYFEREATKLTKQGYVVLMPQTWEHVGDTSELDHELEEYSIANILEQVHMRKIGMANRVLVINPDGYIGKATANEIEYASTQGKIITLMETSKQE